MPLGAAKSLKEKLNYLWHFLVVLALWEYSGTSYSMTLTKGYSKSSSFLCDLDMLSCFAIYLSAFSLLNLLNLELMIFRWKPLPFIHSTGINWTYFPVEQRSSVQMVLQWHVICSLIKEKRLWAQRRDGIARENQLRMMGTQKKGLCKPFWAMQTLLKCKTGSQEWFLGKGKILSDLYFGWKTCGKIHHITSVH